MNSFIQSCLHSFLKGLIRYIGGLVLVLLLIASAAYGLHKLNARPQWESDAAEARAQGMAGYQTQPLASWKPGRTHAEFITMIQGEYDVEAAKFVRDDYLQVVFSARFDEDAQSTCQAIANLWYNDTRQPSVAVDSWQGETRTGHATVINGNMITPPPPIGRRARQR